MPTFKTPEDYITGAYVEEGQVIGVTNRGAKVTLSRSSSYKAAGVNGNTLMIVSHPGKGYGPVVEVYNTNIQGRSVGAMERKTTISSARGIIDDDDVQISSFQVGGPDNFTIQLSDGVVFTHSQNGGKKTNTSKRRKNNNPNVPQQEKVQVQTNVVREGNEGYSALDAGAGFFERIENKLTILFDEPINGPWDKISVGLAALLGAFVGLFLMKLFGGINETARIVIVLATPLLFGALGYKMKNALAKVLVRSWYGIPLVTLGYFVMSQVDQQIGLCTMIFGAIVWFWPFWPLALGFLILGAMLLGAAGAGINQANEEHMNRSRR